MNRLLLSLALGSVALLSQAQDLTPVKTWEPGTKTWSNQQFAAGQQYDEANAATVGAKGNLGLGEFEGLAIQAAGGFHYFYNGAHNQNSGGREIIILNPAVKAGQRIRVTAQIEDGGKIGADGTCAYVGLNTTLRSISNKVTAGTKGVAEADFNPATMQQVLTFDITTDDGYASFYLNRTGGFTKIELCDVEQLTEATTANYTIKFVDENGTEIKEPVARVGKVGSNPEFLIGDDATFQSADGTVKYTYKEDNFKSVTLEAAGSEAVITFNTVLPYSYTFSMMDYEADRAIKTVEGSAFFDDNVVSYDAWPVVDGVRYRASENNGILGEDAIADETKAFSFKITKDEYSAAVPCFEASSYYAETTGNTFFNDAKLVYFIEGEDNPNTPGAAVIAGASNGKAAPVAGGKNYDKQIHLGVYPVGDYAIIIGGKTNINRRGAALRIPNQGENTTATLVKDIDNNDIYDGTDNAEMIFYFKITEDMCDFTCNDGKTKGAELLFGGKDAGSSAETPININQSGEIDYIALFWLNADEAVITPVPSAINDVKNAVEESDDVYNISGQKVKNLKPGLYIKNGKLIQVK